MTKQYSRSAHLCWIQTTHILQIIIYEHHYGYDDENDKSEGHYNDADKGDSLPNITSFWLQNFSATWSNDRKSSALSLVDKIYLFPNAISSMLLPIDHQIWKVYWFE